MQAFLPTLPPRFLTVFLIVFGALLPFSAHAQNPKRIVPQPPQAISPGNASTSTDPAADPASDPALPGARKKSDAAPKWNGKSLIVVFKEGKAPRADMAAAQGAGVAQTATAPPPVGGLGPMKRALRGGQAALPPADPVAAAALEASKKGGKSKLSARQLSALEKRQRAERAARNLNNMFLVDLDGTRSANEIIEELKTSGAVEYVEPNVEVELYGMPVEGPAGSQVWALHNTGQQYYESYEAAYGTGRVDADIDWLEAWDAGIIPTREVVVAVIDTGVQYTHPDLVNQMWVNPGEIAGDGIDNDGNGYIDDIHGIDAANGDSDPMDYHGHGTHCAGTIAAQAGNGIGITGVNPNAKIMAVKFFGGGNTLGAAIEAIHYAVDNGAKVLSNSWGSTTYTQAVQDAVDYASANGAIFVVAAGNSSTTVPSYPAACNGVVTVAASTADDDAATFTNFGNNVDVMAPGHEILSTRWTGLTRPNGFLPASLDNSLYMMSGTSMACPLVAGMMSAIVAQQEHAGRTEIAPFIYEGVIKGSSDNVNAYITAGQSHKIGLLGKGRVNMNNALTYSSAVPFFETFPVSAMASGGFFSVLPGQVIDFSSRVGAWNQTVSNVSVRINSLTVKDKNDVVLTNKASNSGATAYNIASIAPYGIEEVPSGQLQVTLAGDIPWGSKVSFKVQLLHNGSVIDEVPFSFQVVSSNVIDYALYDLDGDGTKEVIGIKGDGGSFLGVIFVFDTNGNYKFHNAIESPFQYSQGYAVRMGEFDGNLANGKEIVLLMGDMMYDGREFIILRNEGGSYVEWKRLGTDMFRYSGFYEDDFCNWDVNGDGVEEILVNDYLNDYGGRIYFIDTVTGDLDAISTSATTNRFTAPSKLDVDGDGIEDMVFGEYPNTKLSDLVSYVYVSNLDASEIKKFIEMPGMQLSSDFVVGDTDGDGYAEAVTMVSLYGKTYDEAWRLAILDLKNEKMKDGWPRPILLDRSSMMMTDLDNDGGLEIVAQSLSGPALIAMKHDGTFLQGFPYTDYGLANLDTGGVAGAAYLRSFVSADVNADGYSELVYLRNGVPNLTNGTQTIEIMAVNRYGLALSGYPIRITSSYPGGIPNPNILLTVDDLKPDSFTADRRNSFLVFNFNEILSIYDLGVEHNEKTVFWKTNGRVANFENAVPFISNVLRGRFFVSSLDYGYGSLNASFRAEIAGPDLDGPAYAWDFDNDGQFDDGTGATASYNFTTEGSHTVRLRTTNTAGESHVFTRSNCITIYPAGGVQAGFTMHPGLPYTGTAPIIIQFTDTSSGNPTSWLWEYSDDGGNSWHAFSDQQNPYFQFTTAPVTMKIRLTAGNRNGGGSNTYTSPGNAITLTGMGDHSNVYVSKTGKNIYPYNTMEFAANSINAAIYAADPGDTVWVADGVWTMDSQDSLRVITIPKEKHSITIKSLYGRDNTIIDGQGTVGCFFILSEEGNITIEGLTIRNGFSDYGGAGIWSEAPSLTVRDCILENNSTKSAYSNIIPGAAARVLAMTIEDSIIRNNFSNDRTAGIVGNQGGNLLVNRCVFYGNVAEGNNYGANCVANGKVKNSLFYGNRGGQSVVGYDNQFLFNLGDSTIENCTIVNNTLSASLDDEYSAAVHALLMRNSIVYNNFLDNGSTSQRNTHSRMRDASNAFEYTLKNNCTTPTLGDGTDTFTTAPVFVDATNADLALRDYRLVNGSPLIDAGVNWLPIASYNTRSIYFDLGSNVTPGNWNNITTTTAGTKITNAIALDGSETTITLQFAEPWGEIKTNLPLKAANHDDFPYSAYGDAFADISKFTSKTLTFSGLDTSKLYDIAVTGSVMDSPDPEKWYSLQITSPQNTLTYAPGTDQKDPYSTPAVLPNMTPTTSGEIVVTAFSQYLFKLLLGAIRVDEKDPVYGASVLATWTDLDGFPRLHSSGTVDVGCYEWHGGVAPVAAIQVTTPSPTQGTPVSFNGSSSFVTGGSISAYDWDLDGDGNYGDSSSATPDYTYGTSGWKTIKLRVTAGSLTTETTTTFEVKSTALAQPTGLTHTSGYGQPVVLSWSDNATGESGYRIQRVTGTDTAFEIIVDDTDPSNIYDHNSLVPFLVGTGSNSYNGSYRYQNFSKNEPQTTPRGTVNFLPNIPANRQGFYEIFIWHPDNSNMPPLDVSVTDWAKMVSVVVNGAESVIEKQYSQFGTGGQWNSIGVFNLNSTSSVKFWPQNSWGWHVAIDAVKFVRTEGNWETVANIPADSTTWSDYDVKNGNTYTYRVIATTDSAVSYSSNTHQATVKTTNTAPVITNMEWNLPSVLTAPVSISPAVTVSDDGAIARYLWNFGDIYEGSIAVNDKTATTDSATYSFAYPGNYTLSLTVYDDEGFSATTSQTVSIGISNASNLTAQATSASKALLSWEFHANNATHFEIQRKLGSGEFVTVAYTENAFARSFENTGLTAGQTYTYRVRAVHSKDFRGTWYKYTSDWTNTATIVPPDTVAPRLITAVPSLVGDIVQLSFNEEMDSATAAVLGNYAIDGGATINGVEFVAPSTVRLSVSGLTNGAYTVTVTNVEDISDNVIDANYDTASFSFVLPNQMLCRLKLDESTGSVAVNSSTGPDATLTNLTLPTAWKPEGGHFDGALDLSQESGTGVVNLGASGTYPLDASQPYSIVLWVKTTATTGYLFSKANNATKEVGIEMYRDTLSGLNGVKLWVGDDWFQLNRFGFNLADDQWHMVTLVNVPGDKAYAYFDNGSTHFGSYAVEPTETCAMDILLGARRGVSNSDSADEFDGLLDDVRIYNYALTPAEIANLHASNGAPELIVAPASASLSENGGSQEITVSIAEAPTTDVVVSITSGAPSKATASKSSLTFTPANWGFPQTFTIHGVDNSTLLGNQSMTVTVSVNDALSDPAYEPVADKPVAVTVTDDELPENALLVMNDDDSGVGSLRATIASATAGQSIHLADGVTYITLTSGEITIDKTLTIDGGGVLTVSGNTASRLFKFDGNGSQTVTLKGMTLSNGYITGGNGGAIFIQDGSAVLEDCSLVGNQATGNGTEDGGAVYFNTAGTSLTVNRCLFFNNRSDDDGGALYLQGTTKTLVQSTITGNIAGDMGGAIYTDNTSLNVYNSTIVNNVSGSTEGAIGLSADALANLHSSILYNLESPYEIESTNAATPSVTLAHCFHNSARMASWGTIIVADGAAPGINSTSAPGIAGLSDNGGLTLTHRLLPGSLAVNAGSVSAAGLAGFTLTTDQRGEARVQGASCDIGALELDPAEVVLSYSGTTFLESYDNDGTIRNTLIVTVTNETFTPAVASFVTAYNLPAGLALSVTRNSGTQITLALTGNATSHNADITNLDIAFSSGAFLATAPWDVYDAQKTLSIDFVTPILVTNENDSGEGSLRSAVASAVAGDLIEFAESVSSITLTSGEIVLNKSLRIQDTTGGATISGNNTSRIFNASAGQTILLKGLILTNGYAASAAADTMGGAILSAADLTIEECAIQNSLVKVTLPDANGDNAMGGAVASTAGTLTIRRSTLHNNKAEDVINGTVTAPVALGGAVYVSGGNLTITDSTLSSNRAFASGGTHSDGGAIYFDSTGTANIVNSTLSANAADDMGGGIYAGAGTVNVFNSTLTSNTGATADAGGIQVVSGATVNCHSSIIVLNTPLDFDTAGTLNLDRCLFDTSAGTFTSNTNGIDVAGGSPGLSALAGNGGLTQTHALLANSPAIDAGSTTAAIAAGFTLTTDQRGPGYVRVSGGGADIGAFEYSQSAQPEMAVSRGSAIADGGTDSVIDTVAGNGTQLTYSIANSGPAALTLENAVKSVETNCSVVINMQPAASVTANGTTTLVVTVTPGVAGAWSFALSIANNDANEAPYNWTISGNALAPDPYEAWKTSHSLNATTGDLVADPDGDGLVNILEYALNLSPAAANTAGTPQILADGETLTISYRRNKAATDLTYTVQSSSDLQTWTNHSAGTKAADIDGETELWTFSAPIQSGRGFLRLKVER